MAGYRLVEHEDTDAVCIFPFHGSLDQTHAAIDARDQLAQLCCNQSTVVGCGRRDERGEPAKFSKDILRSPPLGPLPLLVR
jgi:hypothetical protein